MDELNVEGKHGKSAYGHEATAPMMEDMEHVGEHAGPRAMTKENWKASIAEIAPILDRIHTYLICGYMWHGRAANECRRFRIRGMGRWHEAEALSDANCHINLMKLFQDNLWYSPVTNWEHVKGDNEFTIDSLTDFQQHFVVWMQREAHLIDALNEAIHMMRAIDISTYKHLLCALEEVQNESMRARWVYENFKLADWEGHHLLRSSKDLHQYFEFDYKGGLIDFNIG